LTGDTSLQSLADATKDTRPDYVLDRIDRLLPRKLWDELEWSTVD
jgi:hypothetical protein